MEWFSDFHDVTAARRDASPETRFQAYTLTSTSGEEIQAEISRVQANQVEEEKKE
jgi:hypothetical protein